MNLLLLLLLAGVCSGAVEKPVQVTLDAKWSDTPLVLEAGEFMAEEGLYEKFTGSLHNPEHLKDIDNDRSWYQYMIKVASRFLSPARVKLLEFTLSLRVYSPKIQLHQQLAALKLGGTDASCNVFAVYAGQIHCTREGLDKALAQQPDSKQSLYQTDSTHCISNCDLSKDSPIIIYGELGSLDLVQFTRKPLPLFTILRNYIKESEDRKVRLSGYGVELAIKSTEYKAHDDSKQEKTDEDEEPLEGEISGFNLTRLAERYQDLHSGLRKLKNKLSESSNELKPLKVWQLQDLSFQAAEKALSSSDEPIARIESLRDVSQNLPSLASSLAKVSVAESTRKAVAKGQQEIMDENGISPGDSVLYVNGLNIDMDTMDIFTIYDMLKQDLSVMEQLSLHGIVGDDAGELLKSVTSKKGQEYALDIRDSSIIYINDLEKDDMYARWPRSLNALLQPTFPGMMRHVARNMFHLVYIFDVMDVSSVDKLTFMLSLYAHSTPIRIGLVPVVTFKPDEEDEEYQTASLLVKSFHKLVEEQGGPDALQSLLQVYVDGGEKVTLENVRTQMRNLVGNLDEVMDDEEYSENMEKANQFYRRSGLGPLPNMLMNGVPLADLAADQIEETIITQVLQATPNLQRAAYHRKLTDNMNILDWLMEQDHVMPRLNSRILSASTNADTCVKTSTDIKTPYMTKKTDDSVKELSMLVISDLDTVEGRAMAYNAIKYVKHSSRVRLSLLPNPAVLSATSPSPLLAAVLLAQQTLSNADAKNLVTKLVKEDNAVDFISGSKTINDLAVGGMDVEKFKADLEKFSFTPSPLLSQLSIKPGERAVISAGRLIGPLEEEEEFTQDDFELLEKIVDRAMVEKVVKAVKKLKFDSQKSSTVVSSVVSALSCVPSTDDRSRSALTVPRSNATITVPPRVAEAPAFEVQAFIDPLSRTAQKILPLLLVLPRIVNAKIQVFLNCREKLSELPIKSYYRYVLEPEVSFNVVGGLTAGAEAYFDRLPHKSVLTMNFLAPESWLVESVHAVHDLDNIKLDQTKAGVMAGYELEYLLIEGHCYDSNTGQPPRGLQFVLGDTNAAESATVDTIVMANLGYFQLKANPGVWYLMIRPGRSNELYQVTSHSGAVSFEEGDDIMLVMDSFDSKIISMKVKKREGMEMEELLIDEGKEEETGESGGIWNSISSYYQVGVDKLVSLSGSGTPSEDADEYLNIFSVASGHLYERLMRIMILSIVSQTKSPVKFWLLKNYLSPEFKAFIPVMAEKYGFQYELVQYKWPRWLNQQTEKQRVMWGYKILFLDVLFPLNVKKIAFIDADQIVRTDIRELFEVDLGGAPYGYTPFCDDRKEMDGFRFWKTGYWASHLGRRPYHISALYVIDLKKFRKIAAGDRLRGQYQALSQDPNSLSNLDQDLPNNMIHQVKMKSLPQEWLWCETWCSNDSKPKAKTIDLCNNPLTKEPKLVAARRIVPEWTGYDDEIQGLWDSWKEDKDLAVQKPDQSASPDHPNHIEL